MGTGIATLSNTEAKEEGEGSSQEERGKAKVTSRPRPLFNPILSFFEVLQINYEGQLLEKMLELQQF